MKMIIGFTILMMWIKATFALIGYDCGGAALNVTINLLDIDQCYPEDKPTETQRT